MFFRTETMQAKYFDDMDNPDQPPRFMTPQINAIHNTNSQIISPQRMQPPKNLNSLNTAIPIKSALKKPNYQMKEVFGEQIKNNEEDEQYLF